MAAPDEPHAVAVVVTGGAAPASGTPPSGPRPMSQTPASGWHCGEGSVNDSICWPAAFRVTPETAPPSTEMTLYSNEEVSA